MSELNNHDDFSKSMFSSFSNITLNQDKEEDTEEDKAEKLKEKREEIISELYWEIKEYTEDKNLPICQSLNIEKLLKFIYPTKK